MSDFSVFKCKLITRNHSLLDCMAHSVVVPAVDGQLGIMRGHSPFVSELSLGIMVAKKLLTEQGKPMPDKYFLIDGGFAQMVENNLTVMAYDVTGFNGLPMDKVDKMVEMAEKMLSADAYAPQQRSNLVKKAELIHELARLAKYAIENETKD